MNAMIVIEQIGIRQESGLYCLNDLHRAAGGEDRHSPRRWTDLQQTSELIKELEIDGKPSIQSKQGVGTYVCRELVYAYAMWISPKFHLAVIRAFDAMQRQPAAPAIPQTLPEALRLAADLAEQNEKQAARLQVVEPKAAALDRIGTAQDSKTVTEVARIVKMPRDKLFSLLHRKGWLFRQGSVWQGYADAVKRGLVTHSVHNIKRSHGTENRTQVYITAKGITAIAQILEKEGAEA